MHEVSLIRTILRALDECVAPDQAAALRTVRLRVGQLSGVEPVLLEVAWPVVAQESRWAHVAVAIESVPVEVHCTPCNARFTPLHQRFTCPTCGTPSRDVRAGEELLIHQLLYVVPSEPRPFVIPNEGQSPESRDPRAHEPVLPTEPPRGESRDPRAPHPALTPAP